jgi:hypothetical protein
MQHHSPAADEQPTPKAQLEILEVRLLPYGSADEERPTPKANLTIAIGPTLPPEDMGAAPPAA